MIIASPDLITAGTAPRGGYRVGLDIGGTKIEAVAMAPSGAVVHSLRLPTVPGEAAVLATAEQAVRALAGEAGLSLRDFASIGIGIPGRIDREQGRVLHAVNLGVTELDLGPELSARVGIPVTLDNDVTAAALGANLLLGLSGTVAYLNLGTGLAAGIVVDGSAWRGSSGVAGEIGHLAIDPLGLPCACGQHGCIETMASGSALKRAWPAGGEHPGRLILAAMAQGDATAQAAFDRLLLGAAHCVRLLVLSVDPDTIVIGGGLRLIGAPLLDGIRRTLDAWSLESPFIASLALSSRVQMLGPDSAAAAVGAAISAEH